MDVPPDFHDDVHKLTHYLNSDFAGNEKGVAYNGLRLRAAKLETATGEIWAALRRIPDLPPKFDKLGYLPTLQPHLHQFGKRPGLILLTGATGNGKTTSATSLLLNYLETYGGVAFTIEDPVEYNLEGRRGKAGYCYQAEVRNDNEWGAMVKRSLRWHPRYIFVGEIRTPDAANQLLRAATSGHTVMTTMHAGNIEEALEGLLHLTEQDIGERAALLLAAGLVACIHQQLTPNGLYTQILATEPDNPGSPARALIRDKRIGQTRTLSDQQMAMVTRTGKLFRD